MPQMIRRADGVLAETLDERAVVVTADGKEVITLNPVGTIVWEALASPTGPDAIEDLVASRFPTVDREIIAADVQTFISQLREAGLVAVEDAGQG